MKLIETVSDFELVLHEIQKQDILIIPILTDVKAHPAMNPLCALSISTLSESFLLGFNHNDVENIDPDNLTRLATSQRVWAPQKSILEHVLPGLATHDVASVEYLSSGVVTHETEFYTMTHRTMYERYSNIKNVNKSVSIMKHIEYLEGYIAHCWSIIRNHETIIGTQAYNFLNNHAIPATTFIESAGICIDSELLLERYGPRIKRYVSNDLIYSEYNLFTTTGRCSNKFGGINFAALNKKDTTREMFVSRFDDGVMVLADFESFHLRLIADMIGYDFPTDIPVHEYFGRLYFNKSELTPDEYNEGKQITFRLLYSEDRDNNVPDFFIQVRNYVDMLMVLLNRNGYILSPYFKREIRMDRIEDPTPSKVFNYMVQLAETELNLSAINKIRPLFKNKKSKPIIYTYDSLLFDYSISDGKDLLLDVIKILSHDNKFPMRIEYGKNYHTMKGLKL